MDRYSLLGFINSMTGSDLSNYSIMAMGITPYINASIIMQLLCVAIPALEEMQKYFEDFLRSPAGQDVKGECLLPTMVGDMIRAGTLEVAAATTDEVWFGMTYKEDRATTAAMLRKLTEEGRYPRVLF